MSDTGEAAVAEVTEAASSDPINPLAHFWKNE